MEILANLQAVLEAQNNPQKGVAGLPTFRGLTSKQRTVLSYLVEAAQAGEKSLMYCKSPQNVELFHRELKKAGIDSVRFHGEIDIKKRIQAKDDQFINGESLHHALDQ